jgi:DNA repair protein RadA/Sms
MVLNVQRGAQINQIVVPDRLRQRFPFHTERDEKLRFLTNLYGGAGITPSTVTLFTGTPGSGKSTLMQQMAHALHTRPDCFVLFNGGEESLYQTRIVAERLFTRVEPAYYVGEDLIIDAQNEELHPKFKAQAQAGQLRTVLGHMRFLMQKHPDKQPILMLDSLQSFDDGKYADGFRNGKTPGRVLRLLNRFCKATFAAAIIIGQVTKSGDAAGVNSLIHDVDAYIHLYVDDKERSETQGMRIIQMKKNRFGFAGACHVLSMHANGLREDGALYVS